MCNEFLRFETQNAVLSLKDIRAVEGLRVKDTADEGAVINSKPVEIGLLHGCLEDLLVVRALDAAAQVRSFCMPGYLQANNYRDKFFLLNVW